MDAPPLARELGDRLAASVDLRQMAETLAARDLALEQLGVALAHDARVRRWETIYSHSVRTIVCSMIA